MFNMTPRLAMQFGTLFERVAVSEEWHRAFEHFIENDDPWDTRLVVVRPWRRVVIGKYKTPEAYLQAFEAAERYVEPRFALAMVENTPLLQEETEVELFKFTTQELALGGCTFYPRVCERMPKFGLTYCPAEVALALAVERNAHGVTVVMKGYRLRTAGLATSRLSGTRVKTSLTAPPSLRCATTLAVPCTGLQTSLSSPKTRTRNREQNAFVCATKRRSARAASLFGL